MTCIILDEDIQKESYSQSLIGQKEDCRIWKYPTQRDGHNILVKGKKPTEERKKGE